MDWLGLLWMVKSLYAGKNMLLEKKGCAPTDPQYLQMLLQSKASSRKTSRNRILNPAVSCIVPGQHMRFWSNDSVKVIWQRQSICVLPHYGDKFFAVIPCCLTRAGEIGHNSLTKRPIQVLPSPHTPKPNPRIPPFLILQS